MATEIILPRVDMDMTTGQISRWFFEEGASVAKGQVLFEIETDKAAMEIDAAASGILHSLAPTGTQIPVGSIVGWITAPGEDFAPPAPAPAAQPEAVITQAAPAAMRMIEQTSVQPQPAAETIRATPLARRLALHNQVSLSEVSGSGPRGRIQSRDIEAHIAQRGQQALTLTTTARPAPKASEGPLNGAWLRQGEGTPLVLVHGFGADLNSWRPLVQALGSNRPVFALDLPGHGGSDLGNVISIAQMAEQIAATLAAAHIPSAHIIGHSLGAAAATLAAEHAPCEIKSLLLISPAGLGPEINAAFLDGYCRATREDSLAAWMKLLVTDPVVLSPAFIRATAQSRAQGHVAATQKQICDHVFPDGTQIFSILPVLERLSMPVRVVFGAQDKIIPIHHTLELPGAIAVHRLAHIGHMPHLEAKNLLVRLIRQHICDLT